MYKVGDETEGHCPRCRLNTYQIVSATDGRSIFSATCRTCRNTFPWKPEVTPEELRAKQMQKLSKLTRTRLGGPPEVTSRGKRKGGELDSQLKALSALTGRDMVAEARATASAADAADAAKAAQANGGPAPAPVAHSGGIPGDATASTERWRQLTANLGWRDGKPYVATRTYKAGDVVLHKAHGLGVVQAVVHDNACMVLFRDKETVLEMGLPLSAVER